jgi:hypothetical protein
LELFDNVDLLNEFKSYAIQDSICLLEALNYAQITYYDSYKIDITSILSTSTLSLKIFRKHFLKVKIPILKGWTDSFIRKGYYGGSTDYYKAYAKNLYYYDVNSLYPLAMKQDMPYELIKFHKDLSNYDLNNFFGFCLAEIECPENIIRPLLIYKDNGRAIHLTGKWIGVYFSEELKAVSNHGYKIKLIEGYEFSKVDLFSTYVEHFYDKKKFSSTSAERLIAKMHLNQLYGIFGRKQDLIETVNVYNKDIINYISSRIVKNIIEINEKISTLLIINNINPDIVNELNLNLETTLKNNFSTIKSNVAIAAAVTSYARIHMMKYKLNDNIVYTDTDSIFTTEQLNIEELGKELGLMKDELDGCLINEGYFLGIKRYGYYYHDGKNKIVEKSVFAPHSGV